MAFVPPTYNLVCRVWSKGVNPLANPPRNPAQSCQLRGPKETLGSALNYLGFTQVNVSMYLLLPKGADLRDDQPTSTIGDTVECPSGTGRYYEVFCVDDVAKGFLNEYRVAYMGKATNPALIWPVPYP